MMDITLFGTKNSQQLIGEDIDFIEALKLYLV